jgi:chromosome segregation protein
VQKLFAVQEKIGVKFSRTIADELNVDEKAERAVENLFGIYLQTVLVKTEKDARQIIQYLNENNLGRVSILVQDSKFKVQGSKSKDKNLQIGNLLGASEEFLKLLEDIFPREMTARLIDSFNRAEYKNTDEILINNDGDFSLGGKFFVVGKQNVNEKNTSLLAFKRELRELGTAVEKLQKQNKNAENEADKTRLILAEKENKLVDLQSFIVKLERELISQEMQAKSLAQETERAERHKKIVAEEYKQVQDELAEIQTKETEAEVNAEKVEKARIEALKNLAESTKRLNKARAESEIEIRALNEKRTLSATSNERRRSVQTALKRVENELNEINSRLARQNLEMVETKRKVNDLNELIAKVKERNAKAKNELETEQYELSEVNAHLKQARAHQDSTSAELADLNKKSAEARNERAALEIKRAEIAARLKNLNEKCSEDLNLTLIALIENEDKPPDFNLQTARQSIDDLRRKLENFGAINMLALEELSEVEKRFLFLTSQRQDIIDGIGAAEAALREIKERSREKFRAAFEAINRNFTEFFQELFGGGRGEMTMLEADDTLEAGIEIVAQPPGKRLQNLLLLSGGEKAMTAIALVMAIFQYRPAPFCLLDEVDAPLDDANVGRFVNKIAAMSEKTQFIVITHNKRTMEAAKALYGVTMQEAGISKVVSVRFE